jgi:hypothetical protein
MTSQDFYTLMDLITERLVKLLRVINVTMRRGPFDEDEFNSTTVEDLAQSGRDKIFQGLQQLARERKKKEREAKKKRDARLRRLRRRST